MGKRCLFLTHRPLGLGFISDWRSHVHPDRRCAVSKPPRDTRDQIWGLLPPPPQSATVQRFRHPDLTRLAALEGPAGRAEKAGATPDTRDGKRVPASRVLRRPDKPGSLPGRAPPELTQERSPPPLYGTGAAGELARPAGTAGVSGLGAWRDWFKAALLGERCLRNARCRRAPFPWKN